MPKDKLRKFQDPDGSRRLKKSDRRRQILLELKLSPHVRISEMSKRFGVSTETIRRDMDSLAEDGFINRAHGGASAPSQGHYPSLDERVNARTRERERIGLAGARLINAGETVMIDSGATTIQMARSLAYLETPCTVVTNSIPVAMTLGHGVCDVLLCPGQYLPAESAVIGTETLEFLSRFYVDHAIIGASGLTEEGPCESVTGFAAVKRVMLRRASHRHLLIDSEKFGKKGLASVSALEDLTTIIVDQKPSGALLAALDVSNVTLETAD
ncbi:DeoR/GlpR family DNA-binding transcription regulator [Marivita sp. S6314]|uniref:DeoR/GlpR family DNA-binding transcription regulator n=1 Tax=Marivita sp. S6314 TaxID=2926406 RepID=UPI001FF4A46F|nr:DeoR/GlpR family DNA-binding transcription regulator [Marivita sp. S6314]MCK0149473.1 DeoR/GlpR family DNA-binding transcription regulator [Marivita sp. S6314]